MANILSFDQFSNVSVAIGFEIAPSRIPVLSAALDASGLVCKSGILESETSTPENLPVPAWLQIIFIHNEPDLRRHISAIPG